MGNAAAKQLKETTLEEGVVDVSLCISKGLVSDTTLMTVKSKGKGWADATTGKQLWISESKGLIRCHSLVKDPESGKVLATVLTEKSSMNTITNWICKDTPAYPNQQAIPDEDLKRAGIEATEGAALYKFSKIDTKRKLAAATSEYSVVTGPDNDDQMKIVYKAEKLAALGFLALFMDVSGDKEIVVGKASTHGMSMTPELEAAKGADILAIVLIGPTLASNSSAGALAGAGVT